MSVVVVGIVVFVVVVVVVVFVGRSVGRSAGRSVGRSVGRRHRRRLRNRPKHQNTLRKSVFYVIFIRHWGVVRRLAQRSISFSLHLCLFLAGYGQKVNPRRKTKQPDRLRSHF